MPWEYAVKLGLVKLPAGAVEGLGSILDTTINVRVHLKHAGHNPGDPDDIMNLRTDKR